MHTKNTIFILLALLIGAAAGYLAATTLNVPPKPVPTPSAAAQIVKSTTLAFADAVKAGDLSLFRSRTSAEFKKQFSHEQFNQAFKGFITQKTNLYPAVKTKPIFYAPPSITADGTLLLRGHFPTRPSMVLFDYGYVWRDEKWKITQISLTLKPAVSSQ